MSDSEHEYDSADSPEFTENPSVVSDEESDEEVVKDQIEHQSESDDSESEDEVEQTEPSQESSHKEPAESGSVNVLKEDQTIEDSPEEVKDSTINTQADSPVNSSTGNPTNFQVGVDDIEGDDPTTQDIFGEDLSDDEPDVEMSAAMKSAMVDEKDSSDADDSTDKAAKEGVGDVLDDSAVADEEKDLTPVKRKMCLLSDSDVEDSGEGVRGDDGGPLAGGEQKEESGEEGSPPPKKKSRKIGSASEGEEEEVEGDQDLSQLQDELAELGGDGEMPEVGGEREVGEDEEGSGGEEEEEELSGTSGMSDWDIMMQRRKDAMARARRRRRKDVDITANDDHIMAMIQQMKEASEEDRHLNMDRKAATKKLQMLPTVVTHLKKSDLITSFIECGILTALSDWLTPLPDHSLPHLKIRDNLLDILRTYPTPDGSLLKSSKIGKAVMLLYRHPKETRKNREKAGKIINEWARPIFGLASDFKSLSRDEREERDYAHVSQSKRKRLSSGERRPSQDDDFGPQKPGDKGFVGRARVPMPSTNDYVVRPKWNVEQKYLKKSSKKVLNRYEKQLQKEKQRKMKDKTTHAVSISVEGRNMPL